MLIYNIEVKRKSKNKIININLQYLIGISKIRLIINILEYTAQKEVRCFVVAHIPGYNGQIYNISTKAQN